LWGYVYLIISDPSASFALCDIRIICGNAFAENLGDTTNSSWIGGRRTNSLLLVLCCVMLCVHYKSVAQSVLVWFGHWLVGWLPSLWVQSTLPRLDHVEEVGDGLLLHDGQGVEVATKGVC